MITPPHIHTRIIASLILSFPASLAIAAPAPEESAAGEDTIYVYETAPEGSAASGYRVETVQATGPWGVQKIEDSPYSINVTPTELMENRLQTSAEDIFRLNPFVQLNWPSSRNGQIWVNSRGFSISNKTVDGLRVNSYEVEAVENKERVEILGGLSGFLYGQADPGGSVNYVLKRPTASAFANVTVANPGGESGYLHADFGSPVDNEGRFAWRANVVDQAGETEIDRQHHKKRLLSGAFDWHLSDKALLQFDYEHADSKTDGVPPTWVFPIGVNHGSVPAQDKLWSQPWTYTKERHNKGGARLDWEISDNITLRLAGNYSNTYNHFLTYNIAEVADNGHYLPFVSAYYPVKYKGYATYAFIDGKFNTGALEHQLTAGYHGSNFDSYYQPDISQVCMDPPGTFGYVNCTPAASSGFSKDKPVYIPMPDTFWDRTGGPWYKGNSRINHNYVLGDIIKFNDQWSLLAGVNYANIQDENYAPSGEKTSAYDKSRASPTASLIYKPLPQLTTYFSYIEGLEKGQIVGQGYTNTGSVLAPLVSKQYEVGAKLNINEALLTLSLYHIRKPTQYSNNELPLPTFVQNGRQDSKGIELGISGKITDRLTAVGGVTLMDNEIKRSNDPLVVGNRPQGVADTMAKLYLEYALPGVDGLVLNGSVNYTGDYAANARNTETLSSVTTLDLGARYAMQVSGTVLTSRLYVTNVTNENYWLSTSFTGAPRTVMYSLTAAF